MRMERFLVGKTALVTGASRGLGRAIAQELASLGAIVAINYARNEAAARGTLRSMEEAGGEALLIQWKGHSLEDAEKLPKALDAELTRRTGATGLDSLANNAGGVGVRGRGEAWRRQLGPRIDGARGLLAPRHG